MHSIVKSKYGIMIWTSPCKLPLMTEKDQEHNDTTGNTSETGNNEENGSNENNSQTRPPIDSKKIEHEGWKLAGTYLIGWVIILVIFKLAYNRYQRQKQLSKKKWYPTHPEKDIYEELIAKGEENEDVLRKALLRRAMTDLKRVWELQEEKEALHKLTRSGAIPESMWNSYKDADHDMQLEIYDLQAEAETFKPGWSQLILKEAAQLVQREKELHMLRDQVNQQAAARASNPNMTSQEKKSHQKDLMKAQALAEKMINKKYGSVSMDSLSDEKKIESVVESIESKSSSDSSEEGEK